MSSATDLGIPGFETITVLDDARDTVLRARNTDTGDEVVIKLLDRAKEPVLPKRFDRTRRALLNLSKRNVGLVPLLGSSVAGDGRDYVISPYYPLGSLQDQIEAGPTPWRLAGEMLAEITTIVGMAHNDGVSLGDLRPSNIFLQAVGKPAVAAFGVATRRFDDGSPVFAAPESELSTSQLTAASDVYSLALIFGALIAGRPLSRSESTENFLAELRAVAPERIVDVIEHGLAESPANRYRDASTMQRAVLAAIEADPEALAGDELDDSVDLDEIFESLHDPVRPPPVVDSTSVPAPESLPPGLEDITFAAGQPVDRHSVLHPEPDTYDFDSPISTVPTAGTAAMAGMLGQGIDQPPDRAGNDPAPVEDHTTLLHVEDRNGDHTTVLDTDQLVEEQDPTTVLRIDDLVEAYEDHTSVLTTDDLVEADEDHTSVLNADDLVEAYEDHTSVLNTDDLVEEQDPTTVLRIDDLVEAYEDHTSVLTTDDLVEADEDHTSVLSTDDLVAEQDHTSVLSTDDLVEEQDPTTMLRINDLNYGDDPDLGRRSSETAFADDRTDIFGDAAEPDSEGVPVAERVGGVPFATAVTPPPPVGSSEEIPFQSVDRGRKPHEPTSWADRVRVALELTWFRSRRTLATAAAVLGLVAIAATVIYFLAQEVRTGTKIEAEGIHQSSTTASTVQTSFVATNAPYAGDRPDRRTTTTQAPARPRATPAAETEQQAPDPGRQDTPDPKPPADDQKPPAEVLPPGGEPDPAPPTTNLEDPKPPAPTTLVPPDETVLPPTTEAPAPTNAPPPPPDDGEDDDDDDDDNQAGAAQPPSASLNVASVGRRSARIRVNSNQCVATRFVLSGSDGSGQEGSTSGFNPANSCSSGWNLNFAGSSRLTAGTSYTLTVWVKAVDSELTNSASISFSTTA